MTAPDERSAQGSGRRTALGLAADLLAGSALLGVLVVTGVMAATSEPLPTPRSLTEREQREVSRGFFEWEQSARLEAEERFPGDPWSQDDDFHNMEQRRAAGVAERLDTSIGEVLRAIDEGLRQGWYPEWERRVGVAPCRPRPFYD